MARIKYGPIISDISGSIGSATFQKSLYGNTLRNRPRNTKSVTSNQLRTRSVLIQCQYAWRALDPAVRRQWDQFIAFSGQSINRDRGILTTGHALYLKYNFARLNAGMTILNTLVYKSAPAWPYITAIALYAPGTEIVFSDDLEALNIYPTVFLSPSRPGSRSFSREGLRFMYVTGISADEVFMLNWYQNTFGKSITVGDYVHYKCQLWSTVSPIMSSVQTGIFVVTSL